MEDPHSLKSNEMAECSFQPQQPLVCDTFKNCEGLSRVAFMDGNGVVAASRCQAKLTNPTCRLDQSTVPMSHVFDYFRCPQVMLGKVISCERKEEGDKGGKKK